MHDPFHPRSTLGAKIITSHPKAFDSERCERHQVHFNIDYRREAGSETLRTAIVKCSTRSRDPTVYICTQRRLDRDRRRTVEIKVPGQSRSSAQGLPFKPWGGCQQQLHSSRFRRPAWSERHFILLVRTLRLLGKQREAGLHYSKLNGSSKKHQRPAIRGLSKNLPQNEQISYKRVKQSCFRQ